MEGVGGGGGRCAHLKNWYQIVYTAMIYRRRHTAFFGGGGGGSGDKLSRKHFEI